MESKKITTAVRALRTAMGETQQSMATKMGIAISSMVRYETNRAPKGEILAAFARVADEHGYDDLAAIFSGALADELGEHNPGRLRFAVEPHTPTEQLWVSAVLTVLRDPKYSSLTRKLTALLREPAQKAIEALEQQKQMSAQEEAALALLDAGSPLEKVADQFDLPIEDLRWKWTLLTTMRRVRRSLARLTTDNPKMKEAVYKRLPPCLDEDEKGRS